MCVRLFAVEHPALDAVFQRQQRAEGVIAAIYGKIPVHRLPCGCFQAAACHERTAHTQISMQETVAERRLCQPLHGVEPLLDPAQQPLHIVCGIHAGAFQIRNDPIVHAAPCFRRGHGKCRSQLHGVCAAVPIADDLAGGQPAFGVPLAVVGYSQQTAEQRVARGWRCIRARIWQLLPLGGGQVQLAQLRAEPGQKQVGQRSRAQSVIFAKLLLDLPEQPLIISRYVSALAEVLQIRQKLQVELLPCFTRPLDEACHAAHGAGLRVAVIAGCALESVGDGKQPPVEIVAHAAGGVEHVADLGQGAVDAVLARKGARRGDALHPGKRFPPSAAVRKAQRLDGAVKCLLREAARQCPAAGRAADEQQLVFAHELGHGFVAFEVFASRLYGVVSHDGFADLSPFGRTHLVLCAGHLPAAGPIPRIHPRLIHVAGDLLIINDRHPTVCCCLHAEDHDLLHTLQRFFRQGVGVGVVVQACIIAQHGVTQRFRVALERVRQGLLFVRIRFIRKECIGVQYGGCRVPADDAHAVARETLMAEQPAQCVVRFGGRIDADGRGAALLREAAAVLKRKADVLGGDELCVAAEFRVALHDRQPCAGSITERALPARCRQTACPALAHVGTHPEAVFF